MTKLLKIDYNKLHSLKSNFENVYYQFQNTHEELLELIENSDCVDDEKIEQYYQYLKRYERKIRELKADFSDMDLINRKIQQSCLNNVKLLKKKRLVKLQSNMKQNNDEYYDDDDLPF